MSFPDLPPGGTTQLITLAKETAKHGIVIRMNVEANKEQQALLHKRMDRRID